MSMQAQGGRPIARFRIAGFPVRIELSFVIVLVLVGYQPGVSLRTLAFWVGIATVAIIVHELGHAVVARATGAAPEITLVFIGGLTSFVPTRPLNRAWSAAISLAGPLIGLGLGLAIYLWGHGAGYEGTSWQNLVYHYGLFTTVGWSLLNLVPVLPLDGGQAMRELLPGTPELRAHRAAVISIVIAVVVLVAIQLWDPRQYWTSGFVCLIILSNVMQLRGRKVEDSAAPGTEVEHIAELLWNGHAARARHALELRTQDVDLAVHGAVLAVTGQSGQGFALLRQELAQRPEDPNVSAMLVLAQLLLHDWDAVLAELDGPAGATLPSSVIMRAQREALGLGPLPAGASAGGSPAPSSAPASSPAGPGHDIPDGAAGAAPPLDQAEAGRVAALLGERYLSRRQDFGPAVPSQRNRPPDRELLIRISYGVARGWALAGDLEAALRRLRWAIGVGFADLPALDSDQAWGPFRRHPQFLVVRGAANRGWRSTIAAAAAAARMPAPAATSRPGSTPAPVPDAPTESPAETTGLLPVLRADVEDAAAEAAPAPVELPTAKPEPPVTPVEPPAAWTEPPATPVEPPAAKPEPPVTPAVAAPVRAEATPTTREDAGGRADPEPAGDVDAEAVQAGDAEDEPVQAGDAEDEAETGLEPAVDGDAGSEGTAADADPEAATAAKSGPEPVEAGKPEAEPGIGEAHAADPESPGVPEAEPVTGAESATEAESGHVDAEPVIDGDVDAEAEAGLEPAARAVARGSGPAPR